MKAVSFSQSKDSMFGDMTAAPIPKAMTINAMLFRHPCPRETLFSIALAYLSASLYIDWCPSSSSLANAFSFYRRPKRKKNNKHGQVLLRIFARFFTRIRELPWFWNFLTSLSNHQMELVLENMFSNHPKFFSKQRHSLLGYPDKSCPAKTKFLIWIFQLDKKVELKWLNMWKRNYNNLITNPLLVAISIVSQTPNENVSCFSR